MSEILLYAVLNLFALISGMRGEAARDSARRAVQDYLAAHVPPSGTDEYLSLFEAFFDAALARNDQERKQAAWDICEDLRNKLPREEQFVALLNVLAIIASGTEGEGVAELGSILASALDVTWDDFEALTQLILRPTDHARLSADFLVLDDGSIASEAVCKRLVRHDFHAGWTLLRLPETGSLLMVPTGGTLRIGGRITQPGRYHLLAPGDILRDDHGSTIYFSEISAALTGGKAVQRVVFQGQGLEYRFPGSDNGLHRFSFRETSGRLVGVMGGSGTGKSTLLSILNGTMAPDSGQILINGHDLYAAGDALDGVIGFVPQDDLLFDDLTVFQNLYSSARLCLADLSDEALRGRVDDTLRELHQLEIRNLKVGSPLEKTISGGQRKRLNIALELIREPAVLFADEPTSGLSSADSFNVISLLKEQAAKGCLVIVVIHQPSSEIFKLFDTLWILDKGGRPVFDGNPLDALTYFREAVHVAGGEDVSCPVCGHVNPEQIFDIIEMKAVDERGHFTDVRRLEPQWWHMRYLEQIQARRIETMSQAPPPPTEVPQSLKRPGLAGQFAVFFRRNVLARLANRQYVLVNLLEAPLIAMLLAWLCRYSPGPEYVFLENRNVAMYFFMAVVVALFMGLSVSAEEIVRDRKILRREEFLNLSWFSYTGSKAVFLASLTAVQTLIFTLIAAGMLQIPDMTLKTWAVLFSCGFCAGMLGLCVSSAFRSVVAIYILVPILLIPQMLLAGSAISFNELLPHEAQDNRVPWYANAMPSRWGYEALLVEQYAANRYMQPIFEDDCAVRQADYMLDYHIQELRSLGDAPFTQMQDDDFSNRMRRSLNVLRIEIPALEKDTGLAAGLDATTLGAGSYEQEQQKALRAFLSAAAKVYRQRRTEAYERRETVETARAEALGADGVQRLRQKHHNQGVAQAALNTLGLESFVLSGDRIVQFAVPVCKPPTSRLGLAHFAAGHKNVLGHRVPTFAFNIAILWVLTLGLYGMLYLRLPEKMMSLFER